MAERVKSKVHSKYSNVFFGINSIPEINDYNQSEIETYEQMANDSVINSILDAIRISIEEATYNVQEPVEAKDEEKDIASFVQTALMEEIDFKEIIKSATEYLIYGFQFFEFVMQNKTLGGRKLYITPRIVSPIPSNTIEERDGARNSFGELEYITQHIDGEDINIPRRKLIIITSRPKTPQDWRGRSPLLPVFKEWWTKNQYWLLQGQTIERFGPGIAVLKMPEEETIGDQIEEDAETRQSSTQAEKNLDAAEAEMKALSKNESNYLVLPGEYDFEIAERQGDFPDTLNSIKRVEENIYRNFSATHLILGGTSSSSSNALAQTVSLQFIHQIRGRAKVIIDALNRDLVRKIVDLNFGKQKNKRYPVITVNNVGKTSATDLFMFQQYNPVLAKIPEVVQYILGEVGIQVDPKKLNQLLEKENIQQQATRTLIETENARKQQQQQDQQENN